MTLSNDEYYKECNLTDMPFRDNPQDASDDSASIWIGYERVKKILENAILDVQHTEIGGNRLLLMNGDLGTGKSHALLWARWQLLFGPDKDKYNASCYYIRSLRDGNKANLSLAYRSDMLNGGLFDELDEFKNWLRTQLLQYMQDNAIDSSTSHEEVINQMVNDPSIYDLTVKIHNALNRDDLMSLYRSTGAIKDTEVVSLITQTFNLFTLPINLSTGKVRFRNAAYLFIDELDILKEVNMADNIAVNGMIRSIYDLMPRTFCFILGMTAANAEIPGLIQDYVETRIDKILSVDMMPLGDATEYVKDLLNAYRINDKKNVDYFPFDKAAIKKIIDVTEITPRKVSKRMETALIHAKRAGFSPKKDGKITSKFLEDNGIIEELGVIEEF